MPDETRKEDLVTSATGLPRWPFFEPVNAAAKYWVDALQRSILLLDVLRQRGNNYLEHNARTVPHVLSFGTELVLDGRTLPRPVNYGLVRIVPPEGMAIDPRKRPFIVFDPRAGEGADADRRESGFRAGWRRGRHNVADQQAATSSVRLATGPLSTGGGNAAPARIAKPARRRDRRMIGAAGGPGTSRDGED
jgi:hypothetical protein